MAFRRMLKAKWLLNSIISKEVKTQDLSGIVLLLDVVNFGWPEVP